MLAKASSKKRRKISNKNRQIKWEFLSGLSTFENSNLLARNVTISKLAAGLGDIAFRLLLTMLW